MLREILKLDASRSFTIASIICLSGFGLWLVFLAAIGFYYDMVPSDALDYMAGKARTVRWVNEAIFGFPVERFYTWCSLLAGLATCSFTLYSAFQLRPSTHDSKDRNG